MVRKRLVVFCVSLILICSNVVSAYASTATSVTVAGGTIATGGLSSGYSSKSEMTAITLVLMMIRSLGMTIHLTEEAKQAGQTAYTVVQGKFREWCGGETDGSSALQPEVEENLRDKFEVINGGSSSDPDGKIYYTPTVVKLIQKFLNWLKANHYINDSEIVDNQETLINNTLYSAAPTFNPINGTSPKYIYSSTNLSGSSVSSLSPVKVAWVAIKYGDTYGLLAYIPASLWPSGGTVNGRTYAYVTGVTPQTLTYGKSYNGYKYADLWAMETTTAGQYENFYTAPAGLYVAPGSDDRSSVTFDRLCKNYLDSLNGAWNESTGSQKETGIETPGGDVDTSQLDNPDEKPVVIDPGVLPQLNPDSDAQVGIGDYLELIKQLLNHESDPALSPEPLPALDPATDTPVALPVPDPLPIADPWHITLPSDQDAPQDVPSGNTPVTDPDSPAPPDVTIPEMSVKLEDYFPFCIPFDIYNLLSKFSADPVTPEVHLSFDVPRMNIHIPLDIDMSPFDGVASVARTMEKVTYVVGLGIITRRTIIRG